MNISIGSQLFITNEANGCKCTCEAFVVCLTWRDTLWGFGDCVFLYQTFSSVAWRCSAAFDRHEIISLSSGVLLNILGASFKEGDRCLSVLKCYFHLGLIQNACLILNVNLT